MDFEDVKQTSTAGSTKNLIPKASRMNKTEALLPIEVAQGYMRSHPPTIYWNGEWYQYQKSLGLYNQITESYLIGEIISFLINHDDGARYSKENFISDVLFSLKHNVAVLRDTHQPSWINEDHLAVTDKDPEYQRFFIRMQNGILDLNKILNGEDDCLYKETWEFFSTCALPFEFNPEAKCPIFDKFINEVVPDKDTQEVLLEFFGYCLIRTSERLSRFAIFYGDGGNGKSVVSNILKSLLGWENTTSISLESFNPTRTFQLPSTIGKLLAVSEDMSEIEKSFEGHLKAFVTGNPIKVERKNKDPFDLYPSAKLLFITNTLPHFHDKTDALWRRVMLFKFKMDFSDEAKQNKDFSLRNYWNESGELPGIFNRMLIALRNLLKRDRFEESADMLKNKRDHKISMNPVREFIVSHLKEQAGTSLSSADVIPAYSDYCKAMGMRQMGATQFYNEVRRVFPLFKIGDRRHRKDGILWQTLLNIAKRTDQDDESDQIRLTIVD